MTHANTKPDPSQRCLLCDSTQTPMPAQFCQKYRQKEREPQPASWWECPECHGWFAYPVPTVDDIRRNWGVVNYANPEKPPIIASEKEAVTRRILVVLGNCISIANLLDVGCSKGLFMQMARNVGWAVAGYDPNEAALAVARQQQLDVSPAWNINECGYPSESFQAVAANDVFCYSWHP